MSMDVEMENRAITHSYSYETDSEPVEALTNDQLLKWAEILHNGYVKPDANNSKLDCECFNPTGVIRDTKGTETFRKAINEELLRRMKRG